MKSVTLFGVAVSTLLLSCTKAPTAPDSTMNYYPLQVVNTWVYINKSGSPATTAHDSVKVIGTALRAGKTYFAVESVYPDRRNTSYLRSDNEGRIFQWGVAGGGEGLILDANRKPGDIWLTCDSLPMFQTQFVSRGDTVQTPAGKFWMTITTEWSCTFCSGDDPLPFTVARGIGVIRAEDGALLESALVDGRRYP